MSQTLIKSFTFEAKNRGRLTFSDASKIRLAPEGLGQTYGRLQLTELGRKRGLPYYSTDTDLTVTTWVTNPQTLIDWLGFEAVPRSDMQPANTQVRFRLNDGTDDRYWDGGAWAVAGATDWNTEAEVSANIATFPSTSLQLGVVINLMTTDEFVTPTLHAVDVLMDCEIDYLRSIVADSMVPSLAEKIRPSLDFTIYAQGGNILSLSQLEVAFNIVGITAVYDAHGDPTHEVNLYSDYDADAMNVTLTGDVARGTVLWVEMTVEPEVYVNWSSQDYIEVEKIPAIVIDGFNVSGNEVFGCFSVANNAANTAVLRRVPFRLQLSFEVVLLAEKNRTLLAMQDKALEHAATTRLLPWRAVDESISLTMVDEGTFAARPNLSDKHETRYSLRLDDIHLWLRPAEALTLVERINLQLATPELG